MVLERLKMDICSIVGVKDFNLTSRESKAVLIRKLLVYSLRNTTTMNLTDIGATIDKSHSQVIHLLKSFEVELKMYPEYRMYLIKLCEVYPALDKVIKKRKDIKLMRYEEDLTAKIKAIIGTLKDKKKDAVILEKLSYIVKGINSVEH